MRRMFFCLALVILMNGCASVEQSSLLGAGMIGALGLGIGIAVERSAGSALIGLGVGSAVGAGLGYLTHQENEKRAMQLNLRVPLEADAKDPSLSVPQLRRIWIPEKIDGSRYEQGHWLWVIDKPALWTR